MEDIENGYINADTYNEDSADGAVVRANYSAILEAAADWHSALWDNHKAFGQVVFPWNFQYKENMLAWINEAMEVPFNKYRKAEETGKIPKTWNGDWHNNITQKQMTYFEEALRYLKTEYIKLVDTRYNVVKNLTIIHGDLHTGRVLLSKNDNKIVFIEPQNHRVGLCTEDLAMLVALHISSDDFEHTVSHYNDTKPMLEHYYQCLTKKVKGYSYEAFMSDYKLSVAENLFFPVRLMNNGIYDFRMRDKALRAFEIFVLDKSY